MMNAGLLTPIIKAAAPPGVTPDMRPIVARETDIAVFGKVVNAAVVDEVNKKVRPQQLAVGENRWAAKRRSGRWSCCNRRRSRSPADGLL